MAVENVIPTFIATLLATLIGVGSAFFLNRRAEARVKRRRVRDHLRAIENELEINRGIGNGNWKVVDELQQVGSDVRADSDHYILDPFSTDAWDAALEEQIVDEVPEEFYERLQHLYSKTKATNEQLKRLRTEFMHKEIEAAESGSKYWSMVVAHWDTDRDDVNTYALGPYLKGRCDTIRQEAQDIHEEIDSVVGSLAS